jgi:hypothetical protein
VESDVWCSSSENRKLKAPLRRGFFFEGSLNSFDNFREWHPECQPKKEKSIIETMKNVSAGPALASQSVLPIRRKGLRYFKLTA